MKKFFQILLLSNLLLLKLTAQTQALSFYSPTDYAAITGFNAFYDHGTYNASSFTATAQQIEEVCNIMKELKDFNKYPIALCETRAHFISILANEKGIKTMKIWLFGNKRLNLFKEGGISLKGTNLPAWDYHVATAVFNDKNQLIVFDPIIDSNKGIPQNAWLSKFDVPNGVYFYTAPGYFLFNNEVTSNRKMFNGAFWKIALIKNLEPLPENKDHTSVWNDFFALRLAANSLASTKFNQTAGEFKKLIENAQNYKDWYVNSGDNRFPNERKELNQFILTYKNRIKDINPSTYFFFVDNR